MSPLNEVHHYLKSRICFIYFPESDHIRMWSPSSTTETFQQEIFIKCLKIFLWISFTLANSFNSYPFTSFLANIDFDLAERASSKHLIRIRILSGDIIFNCEVIRGSLS